MITAASGVYRFETFRKCVINSHTQRMYHTISNAEQLTAALSIALERRNTDQPHPVPRYSRSRVRLPYRVFLRQIINTSYQKLPFGSGDYPGKLLYHQALN